MTTKHPRGESTAATAVARQTTGAFAWSFLNTAVGRFGTVAINVALARIVGPEGFGAFAVATLVLLAILSFNELGVGLAIVRWPTEPSRIAPTVNTLSVGFSALLTVVVWVAAPTLARLLGDPGATDVVRVMAFAIVINGAVATPAAALQRQFRQGRRLVIDQVNTWLGAGVSLITAIMGMGAMSLAVGRITGALVSGVMFVLMSPLPYRFGFDKSIARDLLAFGLPLAGSSVVVFFAGYTDQMVIGSTLGAQTLGFYVLAFNLSSWPVSVFSQPLRSVAPAAFARIQDNPQRLNSSLTMVLSAVLAVSVPACIFLSAAAGPVVQLVYGAQWAPSAIVLQWLALAAIARIAYELFYDFLVVAGRTTAVLWAQLVWLATLIPALWIASRAGLQGVSMAQLLVAALVMGPVYCWVLRAQGVRVRSLAQASRLPGLVGVVLWGCIYAAVTHVGAPWWAIVTSGALTAGALAVLGARHRPLLRTLRARDSAAAA
ncbi:MAG: lipopolysaccharide biosynthesis protein [Dermatophilaceae bacterium]